MTDAGNWRGRFEENAFTYAFLFPLFSYARFRRAIFGSKFLCTYENYIYRPCFVCLLQRRMGDIPGQVNVDFDSWVPVLQPGKEEKYIGNNESQSGECDWWSVAFQQLNEICLNWLLNIGIILRSLPRKKNYNKYMKIHRTNKQASNIVSTEV